MDEQEIDSWLRGDDVEMNQSDIPKSTLAVGVILWGVLATLAGWTLNVVSDMRADQRGQVEALKATNSRVDRVERATDQNSADIRELQRARNDRR